MSSPPRVPAAVPWAQVVLFSALVLGGAWLLALPMHLGWYAYEGLPAMATAVATMWMPTLATGVLLLTLDRGPGWWRRTGLDVPGGRWGRFGLVILAAVGIPLLASLGAPFVAAALGLIELDLVHFSGLREVLEAQIAATGEGPTLDEALGGLPLWSIAVLAPVNIVFGAFINVPLGTFGEEWGWRGWLLPKLLPLGTWPALIAIGVLWGLWHAPLILLGHNYPDAPVLGVFLFVPFCILWSVLHGWTRLETGSVWPAAVMHGAINGGAGFVVVVVAAGVEIDPVWVSIVGVTGWILPAIAVAALVLARRIPPPLLPDREADRLATEASP